MDGRHSTEFPREQRLKTADVDALSYLPDTVLGLILSCMTTKEAVQSTLPVKSFRNLWTSVPVLNFDLKEFLPPKETLQRLRDNGEDISRFEQKFLLFVDGVFDRRKASNLDSFEIVWDEEDGDPNPATGWLAKVV